MVWQVSIHVAGFLLHLKSIWLLSLSTKDIHGYRCPPCLCGRYRHHWLWLGGNLCDSDFVAFYIPHERPRLAHLFFGLGSASSTSRSLPASAKYSQELVQLAGLTNTTSVDTPMELNVKYRHDKGELFDNPTTYQKLVSSLIYLTITWPDICYVVHTVSKFKKAPRHLHLSTVCRIICYILGTPSRGLFFPTGSSLQL